MGLDPRLREYVLAQERPKLLDLILALCQEFGWAYTVVLDLEVQCFWACVEWLADLRKREKAAMDGTQRTPYHAGSMQGLAIGESSGA